MAESVRRTMYICDIDQQARVDVLTEVLAVLASEPRSRFDVDASAWAAQVTEEQLAGAFQDCGQVVDCRMCGDPNSAMRFAFIEFYHEDSVQKVCSSPSGACCISRSCGRFSPASSLFAT